MKTASAENIVAIVAAIAARPAAQLSPATDLYADLKLDSLGALELMVALEDEFGIDIGTDEAKDIRTIGDIVGLVQRLMRARD